MSRWARLITLIALLVLSVACQKSDSRFLTTTPTSTTQLAQVPSPATSVPSQPHLTPTQTVAQSSLHYEARLIDIRSVNNKIALDIRYATENNFLKRKLYPVARCVLRGAAVKPLLQVQDDLAKQGLGLKVYDCYRPLSIQKQMWAVMPNPNYVADPAKGSRHNRGAAVDLTLVDRNGKELEMPSGFDEFTQRSHRNYTNAKPQALKNRQQ
ncbi:MAG TPA: peptidase M15, partial [Cyanobacteria bacterium UBA8553]|nr:peptidase M15 [Cyanobacteria bacterium UBA8553]